MSAEETLRKLRIQATCFTTSPIYYGVPMDILDYAPSDFYDIPGTVYDRTIFDPYRKEED